MPIVFTAFLFLLMLIGCSSATTLIHADRPEHQDAAPCDDVMSPEVRATIPPPAFIGDPPATITLRSAGVQILVDVYIEESGPYPFLFDTGAQDTFTDPKLAEAFPDLVIEYETPGRTIPDLSGTVGTTNQSMRLRRMRIADIHMENVLAPVFDHDHVSSLADEAVYGVVGFGHFRNVPTRLNLSEGLLEVGVDTSDLDPGRMGVVPLAIVHGMPFTDVSFEGHVVRCLIDSGANGGFRIPTEVFDQLVGDDEEAVSEKGFQPFSGKPGSARELDREIDACLGPYRVTQSPNSEFPMDFGEYPMEFGLIGRQVLELFVITLDPEAGLVHFELAEPADE